MMQFVSEYAGEPVAGKFFTQRVISDDVTHLVCALR